VEICTFTSPGDFGGRRGKYTPEYWPITSTQFGILKRVTVNKTGVYLDNQLIDSKNIFDDLQLLKGNAIQLTIGIKDDAIHKGGINIFGKNFGDYPQGIIMTLSSSN
jgi:predicted transcriptional regulator